MTKLYFNYRDSILNQWAWNYIPSYFADGQFPDYIWIIKIYDNFISDEQYTKINPNGLKNLTKFWYYELVKWVDIEAFKKSVALIASQNLIQLIDTKEDAMADIKNRTNLIEVEPWKFLLSEEYLDEYTKEVIPAKYLTIN